jgi:hypothetical protein
MPSTVPAVKKGLRNWLRTLPGLAGVTVRGRPIQVLRGGEEIHLGDVLAPQAYEVQDWGPKTERPTLTSWIFVRKNEVAGNLDAGEDAARDRAYQILGVIETALKADPSAGGVIPGPGKGQITESGLTETPGDAEGTGTCEVQVRWVLTWTSDYTP